jgi:RNA polymerase sigma-70 factor (ECF subfamily)
VLAAAIVALPVAAVVIIAGVLGGGAPRVAGPSPGAPGTAAGTLAQLASRAARQPPVIPHRGQYLYIRSLSDYPAVANNTCVTHEVDHSQMWIGADASGLQRDTFGPPRFSSAADRASCHHMHAGRAIKGRQDAWFAPGCLVLAPVADLGALSTDPRVLLRQMRRYDGGPRTAAEDFVHVGDFLRNTDASPALRAALLRALALIPGVTVGTVRDHLGGAGIGVAIDHAGQRSELIFAAVTGALIGEAGSGPSAGEDYWVVYEEQRVVDVLPHPPVRLDPPCGTGGEGRMRRTSDGMLSSG